MWVGGGLHQGVGAVQVGWKHDAQEIESGRCCRREHGRRGGWQEAYPMLPHASLSRLHLGQMGIGWANPAAFQS